MQIVVYFHSFELFIIEWKTEEWHFIAGKPFNSTDKLINDWEIDISYGSVQAKRICDKSKGNLTILSKC